MTDLQTIIIFVVFLGASFSLTLLIAKLVPPKGRGEKKAETYECGQIPEAEPVGYLYFGGVKYLVYGIMFLILDILGWIMLSSLGVKPILALLYLIAVFYIFIVIFMGVKG